MCMIKGLYFLRNYERNVNLGFYDINDRIVISKGTNSVQPGVCVAREMPCWYFEKKEIRNSASHQQGVDANTEARYRREGARLILDAGNKLGLRYDTCATGVVYFHRFYMFHSFKEFHRYVTAACCLFLAGKVEETPKKCKDIIRTCHSLLSPQSFAVFGDNPREEVMTQERILLQTIKFDLQVEHPHASLLKYAKVLKGDKEKTQKIVQMAWTFINDSLCTTLCLQWEPEIVAVSLMYLASRLQKYEVVDWQGKVPNSDLKWWEFILEDLSMPLMEDVCHQVLDLYSQQNKDKERLNKDSPPPSPPKTGPPSTPSSQSGSTRKSVPSPADPKKPRTEPAEKKNVNGSQKTAAPPSSAAATTTTATTTGLSSYNPFVDRSMQGSSFMNQSGGQAIQPLISGAPDASQYPPYSQAPPTGAAQQYPPNYPASSYPPQTTYASTNPPYTAPPTTAAPPPYTAPYTPNYPPPTGYPPTTQASQSYPPPGYPPGYPFATQPPPPGTAFPRGAPPGAPQRASFPARYPAVPPQGGPRGPPPGPPGSANKNASMVSGLAPVRITGR